MVTSVEPFEAARLLDVIPPGSVIPEDIVPNEARRQASHRSYDIMP